MSVRVYQEQLVITQSSVELTQQAVQHVVKVLRMRVGERLVLFDGSGVEFHGEIATITKNSVVVSHLQAKTVSCESPLKIHLVQALAKGERMDWVVQKATELGVSEITPAITQHSAVKLNHERLAQKVQHWQKVAISACEQCGRNQIPLIHPPQSLTELLKTPCTLKLLLHPHSHNRQLGQLTQPSGTVMVFIGAEGGFSEAEVKTALAHDVTSLVLGPRLLRTETAAIVAISTLQWVWGDHQ